MADQIKQIAFKQFTASEIVAGTPFNIQTGATDAYVIKNIEATQSVNTDAGAVTATATIGLTTDFSAGKFASLGNIAKKDKVGSTGNIILDANSTLTIRPVAVAMTFADKSFYIDTESDTDTRPKKQRLQLEASVNGVVDINSATDTDKTGVTFAGETLEYSNTANAQSGQYTVFHTNANGVLLKIIFTTGVNTLASFEVHNATDGTNYGYYQTDYGQANFDGSRYIYFYTNVGGNNRILYYDLDESTTNLASANTYGGGNGANFYHGYITFTGNNPSANWAAGDNHFTDLAIKDGQAYLLVLTTGDANAFIAEIPKTLTNNSSSANVCAKWVNPFNFSNASNTDPFGATGQRSFGRLYVDYGHDKRGGIRFTYDTAASRWLVYYNPESLARTWVGTYTQAEYDATVNQGTMNQVNSTAGYGLICLAESSLNTLFHSDYTSTFQTTGVLDNAKVQNSTTFPGGGSLAFDTVSERYYDQRKRYTATETAGSLKWHIIEVDLQTKASIDITASFSGAIPNYYGRYLMTKSTPSSSQVASRSYSKASGLTVRISGVHEDRS